MRLRAVLFSATLVAGLAGCDTANGSTPSPSRGVDVNTNAANLYPCNLVTVDAAAQAYGSPVLAPTLASQSDGSQVCTFAAADGSGAASITVERGAGASWTITHDSYRSQYPEFEDLPDLGDAAFTTGQEVYVLVGDDVVKFAVVLPYHDRVAERSLALATAAKL
jgi:hypothetical protein